MARAYKVIDADGHILEPIDLWDRYMDPAYREHAPRLIIGDNGKERLLVEGKILGNPKGLGRLGAVGARDGSVPADTMMYKDGRPGGFDPHERIKDLDLDGIDAAFLRSEERRVGKERRDRRSAVEEDNQKVGSDEL